MHFIGQYIGELIVNKNNTEKNMDYFLDYFVKYRIFEFLIFECVEMSVSFSFHKLVLYIIFSYSSKAPII